MTSLSTRQIRSNLSDTINRVIYRGERIIVKRGGRSVAAVVPIADLEVLKKIEDEMDLRIAQSELKKSKCFMSYEKVCQELDLK